MYPINNASPERIAVGQVVLIADGTIQTSGVSITVRGQGGAEAAGGGTTAYGAEGTVYYTPTQAETNFTSFVVIASKASCFSASQTIVTTAAATAGQVRLEGVTHTSAVIPTVTTLTGHTAQTGDSYARLGAPAGASVSADIATRMAEASINTTAGAIDNVTLVATTTTNTDMRGTDSAATAAELAKVPKSDGTATWNATALASINAEADTALADYDPPTNAEMEARTPTAAQLLYMTRHAATALPVTFTGGTTTTAILGNVDGSAASSTDDVYNSRLLVFNAGTLDQQVCQITDYVGSTKTATISAVTTAVTSGHTAVLV